MSSFWGNEMSVSCQGSTYKCVEACRCTPFFDWGGLFLYDGIAAKRLISLVAFNYYLMLFNPQERVIIIEMPMAIIMTWCQILLSNQNLLSLPGYLNLPPHGWRERELFSLLTQPYYGYSMLKKSGTTLTNVPLRLILNKHVRKAELLIGWFRTSSTPW